MKNILGLELRELEDTINMFEFYKGACKELGVEMTLEGFEGFILKQIKDHPDRFKKH